ncbi:Hydroxamate-type ferrichrome siderophore peptide synthetase [Venturia nashicola]|nr:Hydroxamate-type ferrichrome siderophore peptide synthetase [Venturia nashicola]
MTSLRCTRFPSLYSSREDNRNTVTRRPIDDLNASEETIYRAWANILRAYSGDEEGVSFYCSKGIVNIEADGENIQYRVVEEPHNSTSQDDTGVIIDAISVPQQLALRLEYQTKEKKGELTSHGHVPDTHLAQLEAELRNALSATCESPDDPVHTMNQESESQIALAVLNKHPVKLAGPDRLHDLIPKLKIANQIAIEFEESEDVSESITYSELDHQAAALATKIHSALGLSKLSTQPIIPILLPQSPQLYIAMIAILSTGSAFCPLPLDTPIDRLQFILQDLSASVVVTSEIWEKKFTTFADIAVVAVGSRDSNHLAPNSDEKTPPIAYNATSTDTAYIMYTSGSTGQPKGVPVSHLSATQSLLAHDRHIPAFDRFLQFASPTFDVSMFEIFFTFFRGSTLICCERSRLLNDLPSAMQRLRVDAAELTPTVAAGLLQRRANAPSLKLLLTIGEMLTPAVVKEFGGDNSEKSILWGMYGPTEAAIHCTLQPAFSSSSNVGNIGIPLDTVSAYIVAPQQADSRLGHVEVLPVGHIGELAVGGFQLADGYLNRPKQTAEAFIDTKEYGRLYRTGDRARVLPDGSMECLGRISSGQVKLRGQRIELGEIQHAATRADGCLDAVAIVIRGTLVIFCLTNNILSADSVLATCRKWLPGFMVPGNAVLLDDYPRLPSGKVDRKQLEKDYESQINSEDNEAGHATNSDLSRVRDILEQTLGHPISMTASPVQSGLDSLSAIKAASALRRNGFSATPLQLLEATSFQQLGAKNVGPDATPMRSTSIQVDRAVYETTLLRPLQSEIENIIICTPLQTSMLVETMKDAAAYCNWVEFQLGSQWSIDEITKWLDQLATKNAIIRSGFCHMDSTEHPFGLIRWKHLSKDQIQEVTELTRSFSLESDEDILRPVRFQIRKFHAHTTLLMKIHHSLYDGWSLDLLLRDLNDLICTTPLMQRPQFDLVASYYEGLDTSQSQQYWQDHLHEYRPTPMPNYRGRKLTNPDTECHRFRFSTSLESVNSWAVGLGVGSQTVFQAALIYLLGGYLGTSDVVIGTVTSGRTVAVDGIEHIVGPCLSTLPLRVNISHSKRFSDLVRDINGRNRRMLEHGITSLQSIRKACGIQTTESLWNVLFVWQETLESHNTEIRNVKIVDSYDRLECPVTLEVEPRDNELVAKATFHSSVFPKEQAILLFEQIEALVSHIVASADMLIEDSEKCFPETVLSIANPNPELPRFSQGLAEKVEKYAQIKPDDLAVMFAMDIEDGSDKVASLTYQQLNDRANRLARRLNQEIQVDSELICICMEKSLDLYVSILAVIKTGRGYLPITPSTPRERIQTIVNEASVSVCLSLSPTSTSLALRDFCPVFDLDITDTSAIPGHNLSIDYQGSKIAYTVFTSGSTGTPKGVVVTQQNLLSNLQVLSRIYPASPGDRLLQACSQAFDVSIFEIFFTWYTGMCLCSASNDVLFSDIEKCIRRLDITHLSMTPTVAGLVRPEYVPKVKFLVTAGEAVTEKVMRSWADKGLYQGYGPSETTNICTVKPDVTSLDLINNIGRPLVNTSAFVMNSRRNEILPSGFVGELCFGGDQIFRGYLNQPELSAQKIFDHPQYGRLYRSGDTGRLLPDGHIVFSGRTDDQVKIRGQRVELGEINRRIVGRTGISDCATLVLGDQQSQSLKLVTFWVPESFQESEFAVLDISTISSISALISSTFHDLAAALPHYMIPTALIPITLIPMTVQGKVDKRKLTSCFDAIGGQVLDACGSVSKDNDDTEWSDTERTIAHVLSRVLKIDTGVIEKHSSFFRHGLDSVLAIRFAAHLRDAMKRPILVSTILQNPSTARLAKQLELEESPSALDTNDSGTVFQPDVKLSIHDRAQKAGLAISSIRPCTPLQEAMLSVGMSSNSASSYCNTMLFQTKIEIDVLKDCWRTMILRHEILRTIFFSTNDHAYPFTQAVLSSHNPKWLTRNKTDSVALADEATEIAISELPPAVDSLEPPYFFNIFQESNNCHLQFSCHHALHDGTAMHILLEEIEHIIHGNVLLKPVTFEPFLQEMVRHRSKAALSFWKEQMEGFEPSLFQSRGSTHAIQTLNLDTKLSEIERSCKELAVSVLSAGQCAWAKTMRSLIGNTDICFGNVVSGRTLSIDGLDKLVAPTFNTVPIRANMARLITNTDLLKTLQVNNANILPYQLTPMRTIQSELGFGGSGIFSTMLLFQQEPLNLDPSIWTLIEEFGEMNFPVILELIPNTSSDTLSFHLYYEESLFSNPYACEVLQVFARALKSSLQHPASSVTDFVGFPRTIIDAVQSSVQRPRSTTMNGVTTEADNLAPNERHVVEAISQIIPIHSSHFSPNRTIHELGIDSIGAIQLAAKLRRSRGVEISAADILEKPKISDIAILIEREDNLIKKPASFDFQGFEKKHKLSICRELALSLDDVEHVLPCTPLQMGIVSQFIRSKSMYVNFVTYKMDSTWTAENLGTAWKTVREAHVMLRTGFVPLEDPLVSFAMISHSIGSCNMPVQIMRQTETSKAAIDLWRRKSTDHFHGDLSQPPWTVLIVVDGSEIHMHVAMLHALYDAHSLSIIMDDLAAAQTPAQPSTPAAIYPILNYILDSSIIEQNKHKTNKSMQYWKDVFQNASINKFPNLQPLRVSTGRTGISSRIGSKTVPELEMLCRKVGISLQAAGQAAWAQLLSALVGETNVTFGVVLSGRDSVKDSDRVAFPCLTTVPVAVELPKTNRELLDAMMKFNGAIRRHQFTPSKHIQRWVGRQNEALFDTIFAFQKLSGSARKPSWKTVDEYALSLEIEPVGIDLSIRATFLTDVVPEEQARILLSQFDALLVNLITSPDGHGYSELTGEPGLFSITPAKQATLPSSVELLHQFVESQAQTTPERIALEFAYEIANTSTRSQTWTYEQLNDEGNRVANLLLHRGASSGDRVAICFDKCPEASFAILGIMKAGCAYVALDPGAPPARKAFIVNDSMSRLLLTSNRKADRFVDSSIEIPIMYLDEESNHGYSASPPILPSNIDPQSVCYCLYTSGTTGTPKGCELTHENAVQAMRSFSRLFAGRWTEKSKWLQFASFHFDVSVLEQYWTWSEALCVVSAPRDLIFEDLARTIRVLGITHIDLTPSLASLLHPDDVPNLCQGVFITGGEQLKQEILDVWGPMECIHNGYGPTEATIGVTMYTRVPENGKPANIGPQFDNVGSYVLVPGTETPVLRGGIGELCVSGKLVGKGYLNRPDLTQEKFPTLTNFKERVYRTGDLVRILYDGSFLFLGRADDQVKLRGQRLELSEIDTTIKRGLPDIKDVATYVLRHPNQQREQLVTFFVVAASAQQDSRPVVLHQGAGALNTARIREICSAHLPGYMVPTHFVPINKMPLSANNKTEAKVLKSVFESTSIETLQSLSNSSQDGGELSEPESRIADILMKFVHADKADVKSSSSIFELGLDSISVIGFTRALKTAGFHDAQASQVMKLATIKALASGLTTDDTGPKDKKAILATQQLITACSHRHRSRAAKVLSVAPSDIETIAPCTPLQQGMMSRTLESDEPVYFASFKYHLAAKTQQERLKTAWFEALKHLQILRTRFIQTDEGHVQVVLRRAELPWFNVSVTGDQDLVAELDGRLKTLCGRNTSDILHPFEIAVVESPSQSVLALSIFHGLYDGNSLPLLLSIVQKHYMGDDSINYGPAFHDSLAYGPLHEERGAKKFWTQRIVGHSGNISIRSNAVDTAENGVAKLQKTLVGLDAIDKRCKELNVTHQAVVQACWVAALQKHHSQTVAMGVVTSGRSIDFENAEKIIGPMFNTIAFQVEVRDTDTWKAIVERCHEFNVSALPFQHTPLRNVQKWCKVGADQYLFNNLFVFQKETLEVLSANKNEIWTPLDDESIPEFPLAFEAELKIDKSMQITLVAQHRVADEKSLQHLASTFEQAIHEVLDRPEGRIQGATGYVNGRGTPRNAAKPNGTHDAFVDGSQIFNWTEEAHLLKKEIARLAAVEESIVTPDVSIFELGLDSIDAIKLSSRLTKHRINLPVSSIMRRPTIRTMIDVVSAVENSSNHEEPLLVDDYEAKLLAHFGTEITSMKEVETVLPATPLQEAMVAEMLSSGFTRYHNHDVLKLASGTDTDRLKKAWKLVYESSPILRTKFNPVTDMDLEFSFAQVILRPNAIDLVETEFASDSEVHASLEGISSSISSTSFSGTYFRITFARTPMNTFVILSLPHALYDGYSINLLHIDVLNAYNNNSLEARPSIRPVLEEIMQMSSTADAQGFWSHYLSDAKPCLIPSLPTGRRKGADVYRRELTSTVPVETFRTFCKSQGITLQALGQVCWSLVLASYAQKLEVVYGVVLSGRDTEQSQQVLFPTMNTVAFRGFLYGTGAEMLRYTHENMSNIRQFQHFPLRKAQGLARTGGKQLFNTLFIYQTRPEIKTETTDSLYESIGGASEVEFSVCVEMEVLEQRLIWRVACSSEIFDADGTQKLVEAMESVAGRLVNEPDKEIISIKGEEVSVAQLPTFTIPRQTSTHGVGLKTQNSFKNESPLSQTEAKIRRLLSSVSKTPENNINRQTTLFHLGLDSITAIKISALLRKQGIKINVSNMLQASTLEGIAQFVDRDQVNGTSFSSSAETSNSSAVQIDTKTLLQDAQLDTQGLRETDIELCAPASSGQVFMLNHWQNTGGALFFPQFPVLQSQHVQVEDIITAWKHFVRRHPIMRSIFIATKLESNPYAQIFLKINEEKASRNTDGFLDARFTIPALEFVQTSKYSSELTQSLASLIVQKSVHGEWQLGLKIHHALYDGVSIPSLISELRALIQRPSTSDVTPSTEPWRAFTLEAASSRNSDIAKDFWTSYIGDAARSPRKNETKVGSPKTQRQRFARYTPRFIEDATILLHLAQSQGLSLPAIFLSIYARLYHSLQETDTDPDAVIVGVYIANRSSSITGLEMLPTVNLLPLRINTTLTILESAKHIQEDLARISDAQNVSTGLWQIYEWTGVKVGTFVNWLRLPDAADGEDGKEEGVGGNVSREAETETDEIVEGGSEEFVAPRELRGSERTRDAYIPNIDVEVAVRDGALDLGVFGPTSLMSKERVDKLLQGLREELKKMTEV